MLGLDSFLYMFNTMNYTEYSKHSCHMALFLIHSTHCSKLCCLLHILRLVLYFLGCFSKLSICLFYPIMKINMSLYCMTPQFIYLLLRTCYVIFPNHFLLGPHRSHLLLWGYYFGLIIDIKLYSRIAFLKFTYVI